MNATDDVVIQFDVASGLVNLDQDNFHMDAVNSTLTLQLRDPQSNIPQGVRAGTFNAQGDFIWGIQFGPDVLLRPAPQSSFWQPDFS